MPGVKIEDFEGEISVQDIHFNVILILKILK